MNEPFSIVEFVAALAPVKKSSCPGPIFSPAPLYSVVPHCKFKMPTGLSQREETLLYRIDPAQFSDIPLTSAFGTPCHR